MKTNGLWLLISLGWLAGCRPAQPDGVLPNVASIRLVANTNQQQLYFLEDSINSDVMLDLTYYDAAKSVINPAEKPAVQFLANGMPITGNRYRLNRVGTYVFSAQVAGRVSTNTIGPLTVVAARDYVRSVQARVAVPFVNADGKSQLPVDYTVLNQQGQPIDLTYYQPRLLVDDVPATTSADFQTNAAGTYQLQADFFGLRSNTLTVQARASRTYPLVRLPVIIHVPKSLTNTTLNPGAILAQVNQVFRGRAAVYDPNRSDSFIEFVPATTDPNGQPLPVAGLHQLSFDNPPEVVDAVLNVSKVLNQWCPQQYINVFVSVDWVRYYPAGYSYSFLTSLPEKAATFTCADMRTAIWSGEQLPAVYMYDPYSFGALAHELGHFLGLRHTFAGGCTDPKQVADVPRHEEARPSDGLTRKRTCDGTPFRSDYAMDYYVAQASFTYEQTALMRTYLERSGYVPVARPATGGRRSALGGVQWPAGRAEL